MDITEIFGSKTFGDAVMRTQLPAKVYRSLKDTSLLGKPLDPEIADVVATAMKDWAISQGATHYTHWFQPLSNVTAGKHDSFLSFMDPENSSVVSEFSASALVKGEPDASSFPSGGLRATFEARGYTAWDPTSPVFVRDGTLYIPTAFCSHTGEALDAKTPLLRAMQALNPQALRILRVLGCKSFRVVSPTVGAEQEYFLIDRALYEKRLDLKLCGCTLLGAKPPKGQELEDHYCGRIRLRVADFMRDLDRELWSLGIPSKTKHNEAAPAQHELAPIYETVNIAADRNLLTMDVLRVVAKRHNLACLLHEKPFASVNGSGKHNNYSISTNDGVNFLSPGKHPEENKLFLLTLCALIESVDAHADLLRLSAATVGNDARLGGFEAPPAIISVFLGDALSGMLASIAKGIMPILGVNGDVNTDVDILPNLQKDDSDRNRTSPFAFTGNKFEFRMPGSSQSIAFANVVLTTAVTDAFSRFADRLERCEDLDTEVAHIISDTMREHSRVLYNGNSYSKEWVEEAKRRGLPILLSTLDALDCMTAKKNVELFSRWGVLDEVECRARHEIMLETFVKSVTVQAQTLLHMSKRQVFPAAAAYVAQVADEQGALERVGARNKALKAHLAQVNELLDQIGEATEALRVCCQDPPAHRHLRVQAQYVQDVLRPAMENLRTACDEMEAVMPEDKWPMPTYTDLLHRI